MAYQRENKYIANNIARQSRQHERIEKLLPRDIAIEDQIVGWQLFLDSQVELWISRKHFTYAAYSDFMDSELIAKMRKIMFLALNSGPE